MFLLNNKVLSTDGGACAGVISQHFVTVTVQPGSAKIHPWILCAGENIDEEQDISVDLKYPSADPLLVGREKKSNDTGKIRKHLDQVSRLNTTHEGQTEVFCL